MIGRMMMPLVLVFSGVVSATPGPLMADTVVGGLKLSVIMPERSDPRNAWIRVTVRVQNVSDRPVTTLNGCRPQVWAEMLDSAGDIVFPPALIPLGKSGGPPCPPPFASIAPGTELEAKVDAILRGDRIRVGTSFAKQGTHRAVAGGTVAVKLVNGRGARVSLRTTPDVVAYVRPSTPGQRRKPHYEGEAACQMQGPGPASGSGGITAGGPGSMGAAISRLQDGTYEVRPDLANFYAPPGCRVLLEWHGLVMWRGQPVACIDYVNPARPSPDLLPPLQGSACDVRYHLLAHARS